MHLRLLAASAVAAVSTINPATAVAPGVEVSGGRIAVDIVGFVPVICRANVDANIVTPGTGTVQLGSLREFCNSPNGYRVVADYSPSLAGAKLIVSGSEIDLNDSGSTVVSSSDHAGIATRELALELDGQQPNGDLSFRIEPR